MLPQGSPVVNGQLTSPPQFVVPPAPPVSTHSAAPPAVPTHPPTGGVPPEILDVIRRGWEVFPLQAGTKDGYYKTDYKEGGTGYSWQQQATSDLAQVTRWAAQYPGCNWGIRTGQTSGVFCIDTDNDVAFNWAISKGLNPSYFVQTGKGFQFFYRQAPGVSVKTQSNLLKDAPKGVDVRGDKNGYVVAPPSLHPNGKFYQVLANGSLPEPPQWLLDLVRPSERPEKAVRAPGSDPDEPLTDDQKSHGRNSFAKACRDYDNVADGEWNSELNKLAYKAGRRVASGVFTEEEALEIALEVETAATYHDEKERGFTATWNSGMAAGLQVPWEPEDVDELAERAGFGEAPLPAAALMHMASPPVPAAVPAPTVQSDEIFLKDLTTVVPKNTDWLWKGWIPKGELTLLAGPSGAGKSSLTFLFASQISNGGKWFDDTPCSKGKVLIWSGEDSLETTIVPRLIAAGADLSRVQVIEGRRNPDGTPIHFDPAKDFPLLSRQVKERGYSMLIIDPIVSAITGDMNKANEVRRGLQAIVDFAKDQNCAVIGITHFSKSSSGRTTVDRFIGSQAFTAFARMNLVVDKDPDVDECIFAKAQTNVASLKGGFRYKLDLVTVLGNIYDVVKIVFLRATEGTAQQQLDAIDPKLRDGRGGGGVKLKAAVQTLELILSKGPRSVAVIREEADRCGIAQDTLEKAKRELGAKHEKVNGEYCWYIPAQGVTASEVGLEIQGGDLLPVIT